MTATSLNVAHFLDRSVRLTPERTAVVCGPTRLTYAQLVASSTEGHRRWAVTALTDAAVRHLELGGAATAYPGAPELEDGA
jgi:hypothetical protein